MDTGQVYTTSHNYAPRLAQASETSSLESSLMAKNNLTLKKADDLFEKSSMSFGDHLEELRRSLVWCAIWLAVGLCVGLPFAGEVVKFMQGPLEAALLDYYVGENVKEMEATTKETVSPELKKWMYDTQRAPHIVYRELGRWKKAISGELSEEELANPDAAGLPTPDMLVPFRDFLPIKATTEALGLQEPFMIWFKAGFVLAVIVASPGIFYHIWSFVSAGLYPHERRYVYFFLPFSLMLFWSGAFLAFFVIFKLVIRFLLDFNASMNIGVTPRLTEYMSFALMLPLGFGISFQLPLVMLVMERLGIFTVKVYLSQWRMAVLVIAFISMILTPADVYTMIGMGVPLIGLYFVGIALCHFLPRSSMLHGPTRDPN
ncbi:MAG: twin-arginine translocase subunit TatC [Pirellula sp.]